MLEEYLHIDKNELKSIRPSQLREALFSIPVEERSLEKLTDEEKYAFSTGWKGIEDEWLSGVRYDGCYGYIFD